MSLLSCIQTAPCFCSPWYIYIYIFHVKNRHKSTTLCHACIIIITIITLLTFFYPNPNNYIFF